MNAFLRKKPSQVYEAAYRNVAFPLGAIRTMSFAKNQNAP
jgi:hypothetical protein